jgi:hypothetical protein
VTLAVLAAPVMAGAQDSGFAEKIRPGQTVVVSDTSGADTQGVVERVDASTLVVKYGGTGTRTFTLADVDRVRRPEPMWDGAVKGALLALVPIGVHAECEGCRRIWYNTQVLVTGAAIGLAIDAACGPRTVYRNRGRLRSAAIVPLIGRGRRGIAASMRF